MITQKIGSDLFQFMQKLGFTNLIIDNTPVAYVMLDKDYTILFANNYAFQLSGYSKQELLGNKCYDFMGEGSICAECPVSKCLEFKQKQIMLKCEKNRAGHTKYVEIQALPLFDGSGAVDKILEIVIDKTEEVMLQKQMKEDFHTMITTLSHIIEIKDKYTGNHSNNVKELSMLIADQLNFTESQKIELMIAASLHDIGKVGIFDSIINKPGKLTDDERNIVESHSIIGEVILSRITSFEKIKKIVRHHHERFDGKGYPDKLSNTEIPLAARIIAVVDSYDAMASDRAYRKALNKDDIIAEFKRCSGTQFDPMIVEAFLKIIES